MNRADGWGWIKSLALRDAAGWMVSGAASLWEEIRLRKNQLGIRGKGPDAAQASISAK